MSRPGDEHRGPDLNEMARRFIDAKLAELRPDDHTEHVHVAPSLHNRPPDFAEQVRRFMRAAAERERDARDRTLGARLAALNPHELGRALVGVDVTGPPPWPETVLVQPVETMSPAQLGCWFTRTLALRRVLQGQGFYG